MPRVLVSAASEFEAHSDTKRIEIVANATGSARPGGLGGRTGSLSTTVRVAGCGHGPVFALARPASARPGRSAMPPEVASEAS